MDSIAFLAYLYDLELKEIYLQLTQRQKFIAVFFPYNKTQVKMSEPKRAKTNKKLEKGEFYVS